MKKATPLEAEQIADRIWPDNKRKSFTDLITTAHYCKGRLQEFALREFEDPDLGSAWLHRCDDCGIVFIYMHIRRESDGSSM